MLNINLPEALLNKVNEYVQCSDCDEAYKRELRNEKRRIYYRENKDRIIEKAHCYRVRKMALKAQPVNNFIVNEMNRRLEILKCDRNMDLYWDLVNAFMVNFHQLYAGL
jgi:hypothetical protein